MEACLQLVGEGWASALAQLHSCTCAWTNTRKTGLRVTMREALPEVCIHATLLITDSQCCSPSVCALGNRTHKPINRLLLMLLTGDVIDEC